MDLKLIPTSLPIILKKTGNQSSLTVPAKVRYILHHIKLINNFYKMNVQIPSNFSDLALNTGSAKAMKFIIAINFYSEQKDTQAIVEQCWKLIFNSNPAKNINDTQVLLEAGHAAKIDNDLLHQAIVNSSSDEFKIKLKKNTEEAINYGSFGLPSFVVFTESGPQHIFGSENMELIAYLLGEKYLGSCSD